MLISRRALLGWMLLRAHLGAECSRLEWTCLERTHGFYQGVPVNGERLRLEWLGKDIARVVIGVHLSHDNGAISNLGLSVMVLCLNVLVLLVAHTRILGQSDRLRIFRVHPSVCSV